MTSIPSKIALSILLSFFINAPFAIGEYLTRETVGPRTGFPFTLFNGLFVHMALIVYLLMVVIHSYRNGDTNKRPIRLAAKIIILGILTWAWVALIIDQWPCIFLGGRGC